MGVGALWSLKFVASNAAAVQHLLPSPVVVDLICRDVVPFAGRTAKVARVASRGWKVLKSLRNRTRSTADSVPFVPPLLEPPPRSLESVICRANSADSPELEDGDEDSLGHGGLGRGVDPQPEAGIQQDARMQSSLVSVKYGAANPDGDMFRTSASPDFSDEFFTRMLALEASHDASPRARARAGASLDAAAGGDESMIAASKLSPSSRSHGEEVQSDSGGVCSLSGVGAVQLPSSIRRLRRRTSDVKAGESRAASSSSSGCAIQNAFSSMVYMIKVVQSHALQIRQVLFSEWDVQEVLHLAHREMHSSFVWLFQQVFACTPTLMISVMILLANFTVYSMGENVAIASVSETPPPIALFLSSYRNPQPSTSYSIPLSNQHMSSPHFDVAAGSGGNNVVPSPSIADGFDGDSCFDGARNHRYLLSQEDLIHDFPRLGAFQFRTGRPMKEDEKATKKKKERDAHQKLMKAWVASNMKKMKRESGDEPLDHVLELEQETIRRLVAPVVAHLESDNYPCFDRTDLEYQHALSKDPRNALLLANYAQFLYVVRHDKDRAEGYFHQAMQVDPLDSTILGRFASFLWLGRGNRAAAERAYKAAMAADPENSSPAGNYAHFLWHAGDGDWHGAVTH